ncbi:MAG: ATP-binding protein, partial [Spirochaetes bacterium]|nr:ATP-binding protein [Spirochaetota bacterium]
RKFFENHPEICFLLSDKLKIVDFNEKATKKLEYSKVEFLGESLKKLVFKDQDKLLNLYFDQISDQVKIENHEITLKSKNGKKIEALLSADYIYNNENQSFNIMVVLKDITESLNQERKLYHLNCILNAIREMNRLISTEKKIAPLLEKICLTLCERDSYKGIMLYIKKDEQTIWLEKMSLDEKIHYRDVTKKPELENFISELMGFNNVEVIQYTEKNALRKGLIENISKPGEAVVFGPLEYDRQQFGALGLGLPAEFLYEEEISIFKEILHDISHALYGLELNKKQQLSNSQLLDHLQFQEILLNTIPNPLFYKNISGVIEGCNLNFSRQILGKEKANVIGKKMEQLIDYQDHKNLEFFTAKDQELLKDRGIQIYDAQIGCANGETREFIFYKTTYNDIMGKIKGIIAVMLDITELKNKEIERARLNTQLAESEKMSAIGQLAAGVAHEFNNILAVIKSAAQIMLLESAMNPDMLIADVKDEIGSIDQQTARGADIVSNLMMLSKPKEEVRGEFFIEDIIDEVIKIQQSRLILENIEIKKNFEYKTKIKINKGQMQQVFLNLMLNARHAIKPMGKGEIFISVKCDEQNLIILFRDSGIGMTEKVSKQIFTPFFTTKGFHQDAQKQGGTGLGLSVSRNIILEHSGTIDVSSEPNEGAIFKIQLPLNETVTLSSYNLSTSQGLKNWEPLSRDIKILIVDDEAEITGNTKKLFQSLGFQQVSTANSAQECREELTEEAYDIILLDVLMPDISGDYLYHEIRKKDKDTRFLFITGQYNQQMEEKINDEKCVFLQKPFEFSEVMHQIMHLMFDK